MDDGKVYELLPKNAKKKREYACVFLPKRLQYIMVLWVPSIAVRGGARPAVGTCPG